MHSTHGRVNGLKQEVAASEQTNFNKLKAWISANLITIVVLTAGIITVGVSTVFAVYTGETETTTPGPAKRIKMRTHFNTTQADIAQFQFQLDGARQKFTPSTNALLNPFYVGDLVKSVNPLRSRRRLPLISRQSSTFTGYTYYQTSCDSGDTCFTDRQNFLNEMFVGIANSVRFDFEEMDVDQAEWDRIQTLVQNSIDHTYAQNLNFEGEVTLDGDVSAGPLPTGPLANEITSNIKAMDPNGAIGSFSVLEASLSEPAGRQKSVLILIMKLRVVFKKGRHNELSKEQLKVKIETVLKVSTITTADGQKVKITAITNVNISLGSLDDATDNESGEANDSTPRPLPPPVVPSACGSNWTYYANVTSKCRKYYDCKTGDYAGECQDGYMYHNVMQKCQPEHTFNCSDFEEAPSFARYSSATLVGLLHNLTNEDKSLIERKICELLVTNEGFEGIPYYIQLGSFADGVFDVTLFYKNDGIQCSNSFTQCTSALNSLFIGVEYNEDGSLFSIVGFDFSKELVATESEWTEVQSNRGKCIPTALTASLTIDPKEEPVSAATTELIQNLLCDRFLKATKSIDESRGTEPLYWVFSNTSNELTVYYQFPAVACADDDSQCDDFINSSIPDKSPLFPLDVFENKDTVTVGELKSPANVTHTDLKPVQEALQKCEAKRSKSFKRVSTKIQVDPTSIAFRNADEAEEETIKKIQKACCETIASLIPSAFNPVYILVGSKINPARQGESFNAYIYYNHDVSPDLAKLKKIIDDHFIDIFTCNEDFTKLDEADINETEEVDKLIEKCPIGKSAKFEITVTPEPTGDPIPDLTSALENLICDKLNLPTYSAATDPYFARVSKTSEDDEYELLLYYKYPAWENCKALSDDLSKCQLIETGEEVNPLGDPLYGITVKPSDTAIEEDVTYKEFEDFKTLLDGCKTSISESFKKVTAPITASPSPPTADEVKKIQEEFCKKIKALGENEYNPVYIVVVVRDSVASTYDALIYYPNDIVCHHWCAQLINEKIQSVTIDPDTFTIDTAKGNFGNPALARIQETEEVKSRRTKDCQEEDSE